jgi:methyl-accepting chemotaxis protein
MRWRADPGVHQGAEKVFSSWFRKTSCEERYETKPADYFALTTQVIDLGYKIMFETLMPQFEKQLNLRKSQAERVPGCSRQVLSTAVMLLVVGYFGFGAYYSVIGSRSFSDGAQRMADGDLTVRFETEGADELHAAGKAFNDMAASIRSCCPVSRSMSGPCAWRPATGVFESPDIGQCQCAKRFGLHAWRPRSRK